MDKTYFVLLSACTIFSSKIEYGGVSEIKISELILYSSQLALYFLQK